MKEREAAARERKEKQEVRLNARTTKRFEQISKKQSTMNAKAEKSYDVAQRRENAFFFSENRVQKAYDKGDELKRKVDRLYYKGKVTYERALKKENRKGLSLDPQIKKIGESYIEKVKENSDAMYEKIRRRKNQYEYDDRY